MSSFAAQVAAPGVAPPDPTKHVNYTLGMVLGVDDFTQEFAYLSGRDQWLARDLLGYGTVCGLQVTTETDSRGPRVVVTAGVAVSPRGQMIRVTSTQCAYLNDWLAAQQQQPSSLGGTPGSPPDSVVLPLYVVLCYRDCPTDSVPIPGEPCRSEDEAMAASRLTDDFKLELRLTPPDQREEDALRDFVDWLSRVEISDEPGSFATLADFEQAIREAAHLLSSPPDSPPGSPPDFMYGSPPATLRIHTADACEYLRAAFRIWTTELRPEWMPLGCGNPPDEACLLLAELDVPIKSTLSGGWVVDDTTSVVVNEERRPFLIHLRLLQEWLLCGLHQRSAAVVNIETLAGDVTGNIANTTVERIRNINVAPGTPAEGQVLTYDSEANQWRAKDVPPGSSTLTASDTITAETVFDQAAAAGTATTYSRGDHTHGTPPDPIPLHREAGDAHTLAGDVTGTIGNATVERLQNVPVVKPPQLLDGQVLTMQGGQWQAASLPPTTVTGNFVEHPPDTGPYTIVAAGIVRGDGGVGPRPPVYNGLRVIATNPDTGQITVTFGGGTSARSYKQPDGTFQYIVKVLVWPSADLIGSQRVPIAIFDRFDAQGFVLRVIDSGNHPLPPNLFELMIEVSQYPFLNL